MVLSLFARLILGLKRAFHKIAHCLQRTKKIPVGMQPERSQKDGQKHGIILQIPEKEMAPTVALGTPQEEILAETPSVVSQEKTPSQAYTEEEAQEESRPEVMQEPKDVEPKKEMEGAKVAQIARKPYKRKYPTTERKGEPKKLSTTRRKPSGLEGREIDLGDLPNKTKPTRQPPQVPEGEIRNRIPHKISEEKEVAISIGSPFVEIDLDEGKVFLILPEQQFKVDRTEEIPQQVSYGLQVNGDSKEVAVSSTVNNGGFVRLPEETICLETPLKNFQVHFAQESQGRIYNYRHMDKNIYVFVAMGKNRGRMHYLYNKDGNINPIPKRVIWILLGEKLELQTELGSGDIIGEKWIWEHRPFRIDLTEKDNIVIRDKTTSTEILFPCKATFSVEGGGVIKDDFTRECPLFTDRSLRIIAPDENPSGWVVWIQNKVAGYRVVSQSWAGAQPLTLRLPDDLPCECGEFQVDICQQDTRIPDETLFFRWLPFIKLDYPEKLIIADSHHGHRPEIIKVDLGGIQGWELKTKQSFIEKGFYQIELSPEEDTLRFSITKKGKSETEIRLQVTIPRLKWKTSKQKAWNDKLLEIRREELIPGEVFYVFISTNDFFTEYGLLALLKTNGQELQTTKFVRRGIHYTVQLNQFYDTIKQNKDALTLRVEIRKAKNYELLGTPEILYFDAEQVIQILPPAKPVSYDLINALSLPKICLVLRRMKAIYPREKPVCKEISQIYYHKITGKERTDKDFDMHRKDFVIRSLAFTKVIMHTYGDKVPIRRQKKWKARIDLLQQQYPEEFSSAFATYSRR